MTYASIPPLPHAFYGSVTINGSPAPIGTRVEAIGEGVIPNTPGNPIMVTDPGEYGGPGGLDPKLVVQGDIADGTVLTFYVDGVYAEEVAWHGRDVTQLNLTVLG